MGQALAQIFENALNHLKSGERGESAALNGYSCIAVGAAYSEYRRELEKAGAPPDLWVYRYSIVEDVLDFVADTNLSGSARAFSGGVLRGVSRQERQLARAIWITWLAELAENGEIERMMGDAYPPRSPRARQVSSQIHEGNQEMNRPAFPSQTPHGHYNIGMSLRQIYANTVMGSFAQSFQGLTDVTKEERAAVFDLVADIAFEVADAMLRAEERNRG